MAGSSVVSSMWGDFMNRIYKALHLAVGLIMVLAGAAGRIALAASPNVDTDLQGTFQVSNFSGDVGIQYQLTFDGQGNISAMAVANCGGSVWAGFLSELSTYTLFSNGTLTMTGTNLNQCGIPGGGGPVTYNGTLSADGNTFVLSAIPATGSEPPGILVGIRLGPATLLNTPIGILALNSNTTGYRNTASGAYALSSNTTGYYNNAAGYSAMYANTSGYNNNAQGSFALSSNTTGYGNSAMGANSLLNVTTGSRNVGVGNNSGTSIVAGSYNVNVGWGVTGSADETGVVRIGNPSYTSRTYIAGIANTQATGAAVYVTPSGQLGVLASSERYKTDIAALAADTDKLQQLRPVTFHLKTDRSGTLQYGLIAEEVDKIYPELVLRDGQGKVQGVRYEELTPILLSQVQEQQRVIAAQDAELAENRARLAAQAEDVRELKRQIDAVEQVR